MLKMFIVDDEEIICNTIANLINWDKMGIQLIGTCLDGVEAYHRILDEEPDIVMTDIKMPGISGLELIERVTRTDLDTQFIILSGYGEFDYAKRAMKCGVRHYILKPCDEMQIIQEVTEVIEECSRLQKGRELEQKNTLLASMQKTLINHMISEGISCQDVGNAFFDEYEPYIEVSGKKYEYCCIYYLERNFLEEALKQIETYFQKNAPGLFVHKIYISNILLLFFPDFSQDYRELDLFLESLFFTGQRVSIEYTRTEFPDLKELLTTLLSKLKRYDVLYFVTENGLMPNFNYESVTSQVNQLVLEFNNSCAADVGEVCSRLDEMFQSITNRDFMLQLSMQILVAMSAQSISWTMGDITAFIAELHKEEECDCIRRLLIEKIKELTGKKQELEVKSSFIEEILRYLDEHVADEDLTLKWIAKNHLYMNVNYVSRCFVSEMHQTFSNYLMNLKIQKAKEIFERKTGESIQQVAELVGCGNNPYYFSKIFKKCTGMTPTMYLKRL